MKINLNFKNLVVIYQVYFLFVGTGFDINLHNNNHFAYLVIETLTIGILWDK